MATITYSALQNELYNMADNVLPNPTNLKYLIGLNNANSPVAINRTDFLGAQLQPQQAFIGGVNILTGFVTHTQILTGRAIESILLDVPLKGYIARTTDPRAQISIAMDFEVFTTVLGIPSYADGNSGAIETYVENFSASGTISDSASYTNYVRNNDARFKDTVFNHAQRDSNIVKPANERRLANPIDRLIAPTMILENPTETQNAINFGLHVANSLGKSQITSNGERAISSMRYTVKVAYATFNYTGSVPMQAPTYNQIAFR